MNGPTGRGAMGPTELLAHVDRVRERYELGILDGDDAASALGRVHLVDEDGSTWAVGVRSRSWYRFRDGRWVAAGRAPDPARLLSAGELLGICASCGSESGGGRFCGSCGVEQAPGRLGADAQPALASFLEHGYDTLPEPLPERAPPPEPASAAQAIVAARPLAGALDPASTIPTAPPAQTAPTASMREPRGSRARRFRSVISTVIGAGLLVLSGSRLVLGLAGTAVAPPTGSPVPSFVRPAEAAAPSEPAAASSEPAASILVTETMPPSVGPAGGSIHFADGFDSEGAWPTGDDGFLGATYDAGRFVIDVHSADLPVYRWAVNESVVGHALTVEASIVFETAGPMAVGLAVADADRLNKLVVLLEPDGQWAIDRDNVEAFDTLVGGRMTDPVDPTVVHRMRLGLDGEGTVTAWLDDIKLGTASADLDVAQFGIAAWSVEDGGRVAVDDYLVTVP